jgi:hypothetical protein
MSSDMDVEVRNSLGALRSEVGRLTKAYEDLEKKGRLAGDNTAAALKKAAAEAKKARDEAAKHTGSLQQALSRMGGPLAETLGRLTGGFMINSREGGSLGKLAIGLGAVGLAIKAIGLVVDAEKDRVTKYGKALKELMDIKENARKSLETRAFSAAELAEEQRKTLAMSGPGGFERANNYAKKFTVSQLDAMKAVQNIDLLFDAKDREEVAEIAGRAARTGIITMADAVEKLSKPGALINAQGASIGRPVRSAAQSITDADVNEFLVNHPIPNSMKKWGEKHPDAMRKMIEQQIREFSKNDVNQLDVSAAALLAPNGDPTMMERALMTVMRGPQASKSISAIKEIENEKTQILINDLQTQKTESAMRKDLGAFKYPEAALMEEWNRQKQMEIQLMEKMNEKMGVFARTVTDITDPQGNFKTQAMRTQIANSEAVFGSSTGSGP